MAAIREGRAPRPHVHVIDEHGSYDVDEEDAVRGRLDRTRAKKGSMVDYPPHVSARATGDDFAAMTVSDERGNTASSVSMSKEVLERQLMALELRAERRRQKKEDERDKLVKNAAIAGAAVFAVWLLFLRPRETTPPTPTKA